MFNELVASVREGGSIFKGKAKPSRQFNLKSPNVKKVRTNLELSQSQFARLMGISVDTLQNWEQGRRKPEGSARILLGVAALYPNALADVVGFEMKPVRATKHAA